MNVDLLKDNPSWVSYLYIAVPLFVGLMLIVLVLKHYQDDNHNENPSYIEAVRHWCAKLETSLPIYSQDPFRSFVNRI